jgi:hypothetical protein
MSMLADFAARVRRLRADTSGVALLEFALVLPLFLFFSLTGIEITKYVVTKMRVSQMALQIADNAARIGTGSQLEAKTITEADINDLLIGAQYQSGLLDLFKNGRVIISSVEPDPAKPDKFRIRWQRCRGDKITHGSSWGVAGTGNLDGMGPAGRLAMPTDDGVAMFVEVYYEYDPLIKTSAAPSTAITEIASMLVRDRRDTSSDAKLSNGAVNPNPTHPDGVYKVAGVTPSTC